MPAKNVGVWMGGSFSHVSGWVPAPPNIQESMPGASPHLISVHFFCNATNTPLDPYVEGVCSELASSWPGAIGGGWRLKAYTTSSDQGDPGVNNGRPLFVCRHRG